MSKTQYDYHTTAVKKAASGNLSKGNDSSNRASSVYGFSNYALKKTGAELKVAWSKASSSLKASKR